MKKNESNGKNAGEAARLSPESHSSQDHERLLPPRGDYQTLLSFQKGEVIYDLTFRFAHKFLSRGDRTIDQMIQSARSGKKNILEGSKAALTSKLNRNQVHPIEVNWPPVVRQKTIVATLDSLSEETQRLATLYQQKLSALEELKKSLL